jgi:putative transposase
MARPLRIQFAGATYHITNRGNERRPIFFGDEDRRAFLEYLAATVHRFGWSVTAWVLMTNHFHLVVQTPEANLSQGMQWLEGSFAAWMNKRHRRSGHLFGGRFKAVLVEKETYFANVLRYVVLNPVAANIVTRPEDYIWSSYRATAGLDEAPEWLDVDAALAWWGEPRELAQCAYRQFVLERLGMDDPLWTNLLHGQYLGTEEWARTIRKRVESKPRSTDHPKRHRAVGRPKLVEIAAAVSRAAETSLEEIRKNRGHPLRTLIAWLGWYEGLHTLRSIAASLRLRSEGHISNLVRRCERLFSQMPDLLRVHDTAVASLRA